MAASGSGSWPSPSAGRSPGNPWGTKTRSRPTMTLTARSATMPRRAPVSLVSVLFLRRILGLFRSPSCLLQPLDEGLDLAERRWYEGISRVRSSVVGVSSLIAVQHSPSPFEIKGREYLQPPEAFRLLIKLGEVPSQGNLLDVAQQIVDCPQIPQTSVSDGLPNGIPARPGSDGSKNSCKNRAAGSDGLPKRMPNTTWRASEDSSPPIRHAHDGFSPHSGARCRSENVIHNRRNLGQCWAHTAARATRTKLGDPVWRAPSSLTLQAT